MAQAVFLVCLLVAAVQSAPAGQHVTGVAPAVYGVGPAPVTAVVGPVKSQYHAQDSLGQYSYGYASPGQHKDEVRGADGTVVGNYGYVGPDGRHRQVNYVADDFGFHASKSDVPVAAPVAEVYASPVAEVHVPALAPAPVAVPQPAVYAAAPALSVAVSGAEAHAAEVHQTQVTSVVQPAVYTAPAVAFPAPAPVAVAAPAPAVTYKAAPVAVARPAVYAGPAVAAAPAFTVHVGGAEAHASEVHQTHVSTVVEPAVYAVPAPAPAIAVAAPAPAVYSAPVAVAAPAVSYTVPGAQAHASEVHQTHVTHVAQPAVYSVSAPVAAAPTFTYAAHPLAYKHGYKLH